jgi:hypothetical protein
MSIIISDIITKQVKVETAVLFVGLATSQLIISKVF